MAKVKWPLKLEVDPSVDLPAEKKAVIASHMNAIQAILIEHDLSSVNLAAKNDTKQNPTLIQMTAEEE